MLEWTNSLLVMTSSLMSRHYSSVFLSSDCEKGYATYDGNLQLQLVFLMLIEVLN